MRAILPGLLVALALASGAAGRERDRPRACIPGTATGCDDRDPCTTDRCGADLVCTHTPATGPACNDHDACTTHDHCEAGACVGTPVTCDDDGFSCTDDVCLGGECTHVPVDSRCVSDGACSSSVCAPERARRSPTGCAPGPALRDGQECAEDGDACTADVCANGACAHEAVADRVTCGAVESAFRQALALESAARGLDAAVSAAMPVPVVTRLAGIRDALGNTARILAGKPVADARSSASGAFLESALQTRARLALGVLARARPQMAAFVHAVSGASSGTHPAAVSDVARRSRSLVRGTRALRRELRRLLRTSATFVR